MTVETFNPEQDNKPLVTLTPKTVNYFESNLDKHPDHIIRLSTKVSGCTGYAYVLKLEQNAQADDKMIKVTNKLTLAISAQAISLVKGTEIDYVKEGVNGVIKYNNPNIANECGCGESFNV